jgi:hypothetical protein
MIGLIWKKVVKYTWKQTQIISETSLVIAQTIPYSNTSYNSMAIYWILIELSWINDVLLALCPDIPGSSHSWFVPGIRVQRVDVVLHEIFPVSVM